MNLSPDLSGNASILKLPVLVAALNAVSGMVVTMGKLRPAGPSPPASALLACGPLTGMIESLNGGPIDWDSVALQVTVYDPHCVAEEGRVVANAQA
ncbi:hypothetical protein FRB91_009449 [Serendipita sp. 411]|nr:hypothetical protein FRB91_009449 [Serendipita sp. 411]